ISGAPQTRAAHLPANSQRDATVRPVIGKSRRTVCVGEPRLIFAASLPHVVKGSCFMKARAVLAGAVVLALVAVGCDRDDTSKGTGPSGTSTSGSSRGTTSDRNSTGGSSASGSGATDSATGTGAGGGAGMS